MHFTIINFLVVFISSLEADHFSFGALVAVGGLNLIESVLHLDFEEILVELARIVEHKGEGGGSLLVDGAILVSVIGLQAPREIFEAGDS